MAGCVVLPSPVAPSLHSLDALSRPRQQPKASLPLRRNKHVVSVLDHTRRRTRIKCIAYSAFPVGRSVVLITRQF